MIYGNPQYPYMPNSLNPDVFSSQSPPYNFYFNPVNVIYEPFLFSKRISRLDFEYMGKINVNEISSRGDIQSIMQLLHSIVFANITQVEANQFGSKGALHSFMILQMAVEYYLNVVGKLSWEIHNLQKERKPKNKMPDFDQRMRANYESQIQILKNDIEKRNDIINNLSEKYQAVRRERDSLKSQLLSLKKRITLKQLRPNDFEEEEEKKDFSEGEVDFNPKFNSKLKSSSTLLENPEKSQTNQKSKPQKNQKSKPNVKNRKSQTKPAKKQDTSSKQPEKYLKLSSSNADAQEYSDDYHELLMSTSSYASSSGWT